MMMRKLHRRVVLGASLITTIAAVAQSAPSDPLYNQQWNLQPRNSNYPVSGGINAEGAWSKTTGASVTVAVLDTGILPHEDIVANLLGGSVYTRYTAVTTPGYDFVSSADGGGDGDGRDSNPYDPGDRVSYYDQCNGVQVGSLNSYNSSWHGTSVAGIIAAKANNGLGISGVAPDAKILPIRVVGKCGVDLADVADAILWASAAAPGSNQYPARVLSLPFSVKSACTPALQGAIDAALAQNVVIVTAAGDAADDAANYAPGNCSGVINVGASFADTLFDINSNWGSAVHVYAPGGQVFFSQTWLPIITTTNNSFQYAENGVDTYDVFKTNPILSKSVGSLNSSVAAAEVSGVVALMLAKNPTLTPSQVRAKLQSTSQATDSWMASLSTLVSPNCTVCILNAGNGVVDAAKAILNPMTTEMILNENTALTSAQGMALTWKNNLIHGNFGSSSNQTDRYIVLTAKAHSTMTVTITPTTPGSDMYVVVTQSNGVPIRQTYASNLPQTVWVTNTQNHPVSYNVVVNRNSLGSYDLKVVY